MSIPRINCYLTSLLLSYIGDMKRFETSHKLVSFFGIITNTKDSSTIKIGGQIFKDGTQTARWALSVAVDTIMINPLELKKKG